MGNLKNMSAAEKALFAFSPAGYLIGKGTQKGVEKLIDIANDKSSTIDSLKEEAMRQEVIAQVAESQARVTQELAIAQRINTAHEVIIEEFYDSSGKGDLGVNLTEGNISAGLRGEGRRVTKRIYRFTGWHEGADEVFEQIKDDNK